mmetsp:Transcript_18126/g.32410  ORF Transcript_18126/g.32410 Transcript_18126/m.32410 type:complete len:345 (-) Transcript_18126:2840-3874(-)
MVEYEIGLVGLLIGKDNAALHYSVSETEVAQYMAEVSSSDSPALIFAKKALVRQAKEIGKSSASTKLGLPAKALQLIQDSIYSGSEDIEDKGETKQAESGKPRRTQAEPFNEDEVVRKAVDMYEKGVKPKIISSLFNVPVGVIHCWGDWKQMTSDKAAEMRLKQAQVMEFREARVPEYEICRRMRVSCTMMAYITGEYSPQPMYRSSQKSKYAAYCRLIRDCGKASIELGVPQKRLKKFMTDQESDFETIQSDMDADKQTKIKVLESFYANGMDTALTAEMHKLRDAKLVATWVGEFMRSFRKTKHRRKKGLGNPYKICSWISELEKTLWQEETAEALRSKAMI